MKTKTDGTPYMTLEHIKDILLVEMGVDDQRITISGQKFKIPTDDELFIKIEPKGAPKVIANNNKTIPSADDFKEVQVINTQEMIAVMLMSRNLDAYRRAPEVLQAMQSQYSQGVQEANSFKIVRTSKIEDLSDLEGGAVLYRYEVSLLVFAWYEKTKAGSYFDTFGVELDTEQDHVEISLT